MKCTDTEKNLLLKQLRKARDEVVRSKLMMQAIASDEADNDFVDDLEDMADSLTGHIEAIVKSEFIEDEDEDEEEN